MLSEQVAGDVNKTVEDGQKIINSKKKIPSKISQKRAISCLLMTFDINYWHVNAPVCSTNGPGSAKLRLVIVKVIPWCHRCKNQIETVETKDGKDHNHYFK